jgi:DNA (cytosine-5)-methyltransferase 1
VIRTIELFSGAGGLALGLHQAGLDPLALIEWDKASCNTIIANIQNAYPGLEAWNVIQADARVVRYSDFHDVQLITGGPPCQPFSIGGKHQALADERDMFPQAVRAVRETAPLGFVFENVKGLLRPSFSGYFNSICLQLAHPEAARHAGDNWTVHLRQLGELHASGKDGGLTYHVEYRLLNAADYGVPQARQRVVIVGFRSGTEAGFTFPEPGYSREALLHAQYADGSYWDEHAVASGLRKAASPQELALLERMDKAPASKRWRTVRDALYGLPDPRLPVAAAVANHEFRDGARMYHGHTGSILDAPSKTIKAGAHGVPGGENMVCLDDGTLRYYTVRESARLQTFPDAYVFPGSWSESMRQIGNAVPVSLARAVGKSVASHIERNMNGTKCAKAVPLGAGKERDRRRLR